MKTISIIILLSVCGLMYSQTSTLKSSDGFYTVYVDGKWCDVSVVITLEDLVNYKIYCDTAIVEREYGYYEYVPDTDSAFVMKHSTYLTNEEFTLEGFIEYMIKKGRE